MIYDNNHTAFIAAENQRAERERAQTIKRAADLARAVEASNKATSTSTPTPTPIPVSSHPSANTNYITPKKANWFTRLLKRTAIVTGLGMSSFFAVISLTPPNSEDDSSSSSIDDAPAYPMATGSLKGLDTNNRYNYQLSEYTEIPPPTTSTNPTLQERFPAISVVALKAELQKDFIDYGEGKTNTVWFYNDSVDTAPTIKEAFSTANKFCQKSAKYMATITSKASISNFQCEQLIGVPAGKPSCIAFGNVTTHSPVEIVYTDYKGARTIQFSNTFARVIEPFTLEKACGADPVDPTMSEYCNYNSDVLCNYDPR